MKQQNGFGLVRRSLLWTTGVFALTAFHHYYGSVVYGTPWRAHIVFIGGITLLLCFLLSWLYHRYQNKFLVNIYVVIALVIFGLLIGLFEGFYNHAVKNLLYFSGMNGNNWRTLFPAPTYEVPDNILFEGTGILQFPAGVAQLYSLYKVYKSYNTIKQ
jgi:multisubunit Na+/H+ antiporter MnhF subunit